MPFVSDAGEVASFTKRMIDTIPRTDSTDDEKIAALEGIKHECDEMEEEIKHPHE